MKRHNNIDILLLLLASGSPEQLQRDAFEKLYLFYWAPLRKYAERRTEENLIDDMLQDIFSNLWACRKTLVNGKTDNKAKLEKWLLDAVRSKAANLNTFRKRQVQIDDEGIATEMEEKTTAPSEQIEFTERRRYEEKLRETVRKLPAGLKLIYSLKREYGYSVKEIACCMGVSETHVKESFRKAKETIEEKMLKTYQIDGFLSEYNAESKK